MLEPESPPGARRELRLSCCPCLALTLAPRWLPPFPQVPPERFADILYNFCGMQRLLFFGVGPLAMGADIAREVDGLLLHMYEELCATARLLDSIKRAGARRTKQQLLRAGVSAAQLRTFALAAVCCGVIPRYARHTATWNGELHLRIWSGVAVDTLETMGALGERDDELRLIIRHINFEEKLPRSEPFTADINAEPALIQ